MKKKYLAAVTALASLCALAQPQIRQEHVGASLSANLYYADVQNFDPGPDGPNQTWDFSSLNSVNAGQATILPAAGTPYANSYLMADHCFLYQGQGVDLWYYNKTSAQKLETVSMIFAGVFALNYTQNPMTVVEFPYDFNDVFTDSYGPTVASSTEFTATYDGYGTLILPFGTYQNVIRQKVEEDGKIEYNWFHSDPFFPLLQTSIEDGSVGMVEPTSLSVENPTGNFRPTVYPNPFHDVVALRLPSGTSGTIRVAVTDVLGKVVYRDEFAGPDADDVVTIDLSDCASGVYFLDYWANDRKGSVQKIVRQ
ncbi:T9SS type A sorting domain-containing protein [Flavobacterium selenitireducens]|uniref:T9SS type A sorting domain-containing protein n=1 Tax=Flavobacterium selenitireducens TaxID=2722704 RepID=UPI00168B0988|nr:T9SS type A sorting domain-containing protein [Flavobacterium selenitireducens]MBD3581085.1 T9SS type A sorting domain-containing protein [Flavobacterium selenitireducens]